MCSGREKTSILRGSVPLLAILVITMLCTAGCILLEPEETKPPVNAETPVTVVTTVPTLQVTQAPVVSVSIPVKNVTITRPEKLKPYTQLNLPAGVAASLSSASEPGTMENITMYLRWESVRLRTGSSEAARIERTVSDLDTAIQSSRLGEDLVLYTGVTGDISKNIVNESRYTEDGFLTCSFDPSVIYRALERSGRDQNGYVSLLVIQEKRGSYLLYLNETHREVLLPRSMAFELASEEKVGRIEFTAASVPRYRDDEMKNVRLLFMTPIT